MISEVFMVLLKYLSTFKRDTTIVIIFAANYKKGDKAKGIIRDEWRHG